ncbi:MAG: carboxypeptidase-like regulatory domain-containing protein [Planctomycetota bacterium]
MSKSLRRLSLLIPLLVAGGCDNVGRAFDRDVNPNAPGPETAESPVQVVRVGGIVRDGRPKVRATQPEGAGWPSVVPIVIEFSESVNEDSITPTSPTGTDGRIILRVKGTTQALPCQYDFLAKGRLLVMRPLTELSNEGNPTYEVVLLADARDCDGVRFQVEEGGKVLTEFQVNQDAASTDGRILALFPRDNQKDQLREGECVVVFDRPANPTTVVAANLSVRTPAGDAVSLDIELPLATVGVPDGRVVRFRPQNGFPPASPFELVVTDAITFGQDGNLDFRGRTPFARFETVAPAAPTEIELANPSPGFDDKINRDNVGTVVLRVTTPADTVAGDRVLARIYGGDAGTDPAGDVAFAERSAAAPADGAQTVDIDFSGALGSLDNPDFDDGELTFAAQLVRGSQTSGFIHQPANSTPLFDVTPPTLTTAGPPTGADARDLVSDLEYVAFYGQASEALSSASLADGVNPAVGVFGAGDDGRFVMAPIGLGRLVTPRGYSLTLTDRAGNLSAAAVNGNLVLRGFITGTLVDSLTAEAFDQTTLLPIADATVLLDVGAPTVPPTGRQVGTTGAAGRVVFTGLAPGLHTITIVRAGYDLVTMYTTAASFVSLPLRPLTNATAIGKGTAAFTPSPGTTAIVGNTAIADRSVLGIRTANAAPNTIPDTPILANRPQLITAFSGAFEPTAVPTFTGAGCNLLGATLTVASPPGAPAAGGAESAQNIAIVPAANTTGALLFPFLNDFGAATGLDLGNLVGGAPRVRVTASLQGFEGQALVGIGFIPSVAGTAYSASASFSLPILGGLALFAPTPWVAVDAGDTAGRVSRTRGLLIVSGFTLPGVGPSPIPVITPPGGPVSGSPAVQVVDPYDPALVPGGQGLFELTATDAAGRRWVVFAADRDGLGGTDTLQFPDLTSPAVAGLAAGAWTLQAEVRLWLSSTLGSPDDFMLSDRVRQEVNYVRSAPVTVTVQ